jgi:hypothetical protein
MPTRRRRRRPTIILAFAALAAACKPGTAPDLDAILDTDASLADYDAVESLLASPDWEGFRALGGRTPFSASPGAPAAAPIISETHRGATFVYDPATDQYVVDPDREGAPATGVRFVLYEVDDAGLPVVEEVVGHANLVDEGDGSAEDVALRLVVVANGRTALDYRTTLDIGLLWGELTVLGFLEGENGVRLDFDIEARGTQSPGGGTLDVTFDLGVESRGFSITGSVSGVEEGGEGEGEVELTFRHRHHTIEVDMTGASGQLDGSLLLNDELFATVGGDAESPTILSADGDPLTFDEQLVLHRVLDTIEDVFDFLEDLVDPVDELVLVGIIL